MLRREIIAIYFDNRKKPINTLRKYEKLLHEGYSLLGHSLVEVDRRFRGAYCLQNRPNDGRTHLWKSVYFNESTRSYIPDDFNLYTRRRKNIKSHKELLTIKTGGRYNYRRSIRVNVL
jgi:hypothetical protein